MSKAERPIEDSVRVDQEKVKHAARRLLVAILSTGKTHGPLTSEQQNFAKLVVSTGVRK